MKAEIITIGDEILLGQIVDSNSAWIAQELFKFQIPITHIQSISDDRSAIFEALDSAQSRADLIVVTGGLGPTKDDVTKETIASYFGTTLVRNTAVLDHVKQLFSKLGYERMPDANYKQADVLANATVLFNDVGTAPGMWVESKQKVFVFLPGVPFEMMYLMTNRVLPQLKNQRQDVFLVNRHLLTIGLGESHLAEKIADIENELPSNIKLAYLPKIGLLRLRLSGVGENEQQLVQEVEHFEQRLADRLNEYLVAREDISIEEAFIKTFSAMGLTLSTAESCTGGGLGARLTQYDGASKIYQGSIVAYSNEVKENVLNVSKDTLKSYGAVSEETVLEMANGVKKLLQTDYAIATSGIAGPTGGTDEKPVGTVWIAVVGKNGFATKKFHFKNNRVINIERSIAQAWLMLWKLYKDEIV